MKWKEEELYARAMAGLPRNLYGRERGNLRYARLGLIKWPMYSPRKTLRGKVPVRWQGLSLRFAVNVDFSYLNKYLDWQRADLPGGLLVTRLSTHLRKSECKKDVLDERLTPLCLHPLLNTCTSFMQIHVWSSLTQETPPTYTVLTQQQTDC